MGWPFFLGGGGAGNPQGGADTGTTPNQAAPLDSPSGGTGSDGTVAGTGPVPGPGPAAGGDDDDDDDDDEPASPDPGQPQGPPGELISPRGQVGQNQGSQIDPGQPDSDGNAIVGADDHYEGGNSWGEPEDGGGGALDYASNAVQQVWYGNYTPDDQRNLAGTAGEIVVGLLPIVSTVASARDLSYDVMNWKWEVGHAIQTGADIAGLIPFVRAFAKGGRAAVRGYRSGTKVAQGLSKVDGMVVKTLGKADDAADLVKNADEFGDGVKAADDVASSTVSSLMIGWRGGEVVSDAALNQLERGLLRDGVTLARNADAMLDQKGAHGLLRVYKDGSATMFLRSNPTRYEVLHESQHLEQLRQIGANNYFQLASTPQGNLQLEQFVYDNLRQYHWGTLSPDEIAHAGDYIRKLGGNPW